jgi:hypothetical protein
MVGRARGRSCTSVLVIPRRKMALVRALHGRAAMARGGARPERKDRGKGRGRECAWLGGTMGGGGL